MIAGRTTILVDDGLATGATMRAAVAAVRRLGAGRVVVAVPVAPQDTCRALSEEADEVVCLASPEPFQAIGCWYDRFPQVSDAEVRDLLQHSRAMLMGSNVDGMDGTLQVRETSAANRDLSTIGVSPKSTPLVVCPTSTNGSFGTPPGGKVCR